MGLVMTVASATNPQSKQPPVWFRVGMRRPINDEFKKDQRCNCIGKKEFFFSDDLSDQAIARKLCAECPLLHPCTLWTLTTWQLQPYGIFAGMDPDQRARIAMGREDYWDWARDFNYAAKAARAAARMREKNRIRKRDQRRAELPLCPGCGNSQHIIREGRDRNTNRQQYQCTACGPYFLGEEL